jgi:HPt (histidine-containing phosphotransfer) domain-containing protein
VKISTSMAKLSNETLTITFTLLRQLAEEIEQACATEWIFFERYGETTATINELDDGQANLAAANASIQEIQLKQQEPHTSRSG